ncbi:MAG: hypothetical protein SXG53_23625 [Pseudomonadota bacterium]|nr:hypothetical protein [Pseudomonadota bacterium]
MSLRFPLIALAVAAALPTVASAVDFTYSGFSTAAYAQSDTDDAVVGTGPESIDKHGTYKMDSKFGLQVGAKFNEMVSATVQGVGYADMSGEWAPRVDWAYLSVKPVQNLNLRGGYLRAPTFMYSDSIFVGYANTWVRAPFEVYSQVPVYQLLGVDATWRTQLGPVAVAVNPFFGEADINLKGDSMKGKDWGGLVTTATYGSTQARVAYSQFTFDTTLNPVGSLVDSLRAVPAEDCDRCAAEANRLTMDGQSMKILNLGVQYDDGSNFVASEYARVRMDHNYLISNTNSAYLSYGRRFGSLMPYATLGALRRDQSLSSNAIPATGELADLSATVNSVIQGGLNDQTSYSVGVRYELPSFSVVKGALVKLQFDHLEATGSGGLLYVQPSFDGTVNVVSASFDFIF